MHSTRWVHRIHRVVLRIPSRINIILKRSFSSFRDAAVVAAIVATIVVGVSSPPPPPPSPPSFEGGDSSRVLPSVSSLTSPLTSPLSSPLSTTSVTMHGSHPQRPSRYRGERAGADPLPFSTRSKTYINKGCYRISCSLQGWVMVGGPLTIQNKLTRSEALPVPL